MSQLETAGVVGAGTMGHGIAQVCARAGLRILLYDVTPQLARAGKARIAADLDQGIAKGKVTPEEKARALERVTATSDLQELAGCEVIFEAAPEELALKTRLFRELSALCRPDALLATNTSALSVTEIAASAKEPSRVVGMHFFNPVQRMRLLELVRPLQASDGAMAQARELGVRLGKELIEVKDVPGFASSRLGIALGMEAIRMVEEGVASPEDIDRAMELGYGHPMGPLKLTDLVGLDVRLKIATYLYEELGNPGFHPPPLLRKMVRAGKLGRKSGEGFYRY